MKKTVIFHLLLAAIFISGCKEQKIASDPPPAPRIEENKIVFATNAPQLEYLTIETAEVRTAAAVGLYGRLAWDDDVTVRVFSPVGGRVARVRVEVNDAVEKGDALVSLESPDYGQAQSDARKGASDLALADRTLSRLRELFEHGAAAQKDVDSAEADYAKAKSEYERATAQLLALSNGHTNSAPGTYELCSPLSGTVVEKSITPGQQVRSDQMLANAPQFVNPLFVVTDPSRLWLFLDVNELDIRALQPSQEVLIHSKAYPDKTFHGRLAVIGGGLDASTRTVKARCRVDNSDKLLRAEMYVTADVASGMPSGVDVATKAVFLRNNQYFVFVETERGQFERREVKLGLESNGRSVVVEGIMAGQRVVTEGCLLLESLLDGESS
jgi:cobalt-zinc-cadmium efflux system membrane fusion protein